MKRPSPVLVPTALALLLAAGCAAAPSGPPQELAVRLIAELDAGDPEEAHGLFARVRGDAAYRERIYPILFETARQRYERGEAGGAAALLRFLAQEYPTALSVREALLYALFLQRAGELEPDLARSIELTTLAQEVRAASADPSPWLALAETQAAIDQGRLPEARASLASFQERWDGQPSALVAYVEDLDRYLRSHGDAE